MKIARFAASLVVIASLSLSTVTPAQAFTLFGVRFFEKSQPTPTPTATPSPTPRPTTTPRPTDANGQVLGENDHLPATGPEESVGLILLAVSGAFVARKLWQVNHQL